MSPFETRTTTLRVLARGVPRIALPERSGGIVFVHSVGWMRAAACAKSVGGIAKSLSSSPRLAMRRSSLPRQLLPERRQARFVAQTREDRIAGRAERELVVLCDGVGERVDSSLALTEGSLGARQQRL
jgi:hypothetical protein